MDMEKLMQQKVQFTISEKYDLLHESIYVLMKLKEKKLSHLDIKPCNILIKKLDDGYTTKFSDFGTARNS